MDNTTQAVWRHILFFCLLLLESLATGGFQERLGELEYVTRASIDIGMSEISIFSELSL